MCESFEEARRFVARVRFKDDEPHEPGDSSAAGIDQVRSLFQQHGLVISDAVTPVLAKRLDEVCGRLRMPADRVDAFVYSSSEIQAQAVVASQSDCLIRFSSGLIDILGPDEFGYVVGHELGHFLLGHGLGQHSDEPSVEFFIEQRASEISCDRVGLIACGSLETAIKAMMKTASGLSDRHLRYDVGAFLSQLRGTEQQAHLNIGASHPSILLRCRALLWFSMKADLSSDEILSQEDKIALDRDVARDLDKFADGPARELIAEARRDLEMWMIVAQVVEDGKFEKQEQEFFAAQFGEETLARLRDFLSTMTVPEAKLTVQSRVDDARDFLQRLIPSSFEREYVRLQRSLTSHGN